MALTSGSCFRFSKCFNPFLCLFSILCFFPFEILRTEKTEFSDTSLLATVRRYSKPTLVEEVEGRIEYKVTITQKVVTRSKKYLSDFYQFNHTCTCQSVKSTCIHIALLLISEFCKPDED